MINSISAHQITAPASTTSAHTRMLILGLVALVRMEQCKALGSTITHYG
jgi:hypothetical protein